MQFGAYMSLKKDTWTEGEWIPTEWNPEGQVGVIDHIIGQLRHWVDVVRSSGEQLKMASSEISGGEMGNYYGDSDYDIIGADYLGAEVEDYLDEISPIADADASDFNMQYLPDDGQIFDVFPYPNSNTLMSIWDRILELPWAFVDGKYLSSEWRKNYNDWINWQDFDSDPAYNAQKAGRLLVEYAQEMETQIIPQIINMRREWVDEVRRLETQAHTEFIETAMEQYGDAARFAESVAGLADETYNSLREATNTRAIDEIKVFLKALKLAITDFPDDEDLGESDYAHMMRCADDLSDIASRQYHNDIRAWESRALQSQDAQIVVDKVRSYWAKRAEELTEPKALIKRHNTKAHAGTVPSYKFKIGQMVKVRKSRRYGKVVGARLEGGTGKQQYDVRVNGVDNLKRYYASELERSES